MKVLVIGCGRFGVRMAENLTRKNHDVVMIDNDAEAFCALSEEFTGRTICGVGYDRDVLEDAGIASADVVISCSSSDAVNAVIANVAKNIYHVPTVIARMYDTTRARMFESMGIYTVSITRLGTDNVMEFLEDNRGWRVIRKFGSEDVQLVRVHITASTEGTPLSELTVPGKMMPVTVERGGRSMLPDKDMVCEYNDMLYLAISRDYLLTARDMLQI